jgi:hypothetical protein
MLSKNFGNLNRILSAVKHLLDDLTVFQGKMIPIHESLLSKRDAAFQE